MKCSKIRFVRSVGRRQTRDITVESEDHLYLANGIVTSNSHAVAYSAISSIELYLKYHYFIEFVTALINNAPRGKKRFGSETFIDYLSYVRRKGFTLLPPNVNKSDKKFTIENGHIRFGLDQIKNVASSAACIVEHSPYKDIADFYERAKNEKGKRPSKRVVESLIAANAFSDFGDRNKVYEDYYALRSKLVKPEPLTDEEWEEVPSKITKKTMEAFNVNAPYVSMADFLERGKTLAGRAFTKKAVKKFIAAGLFDDIGDKNTVSLRYYELKMEEVYPGTFTKKEWEEAEKEMTGVCLSRPPLLMEYKDIIKEKGCLTIGRNQERSKVRVFGRIENIEARRSKKGNNMLIVKMTDDIDSMEFFVFTNSIQYFIRRVLEGMVVVLPMKRFEDTGMRFFDDSSDYGIEIIKSKSE